MSSIRERNRDLILRAASEEFAEKGFAATKTSDIAAKAGLPKQLAYYGCLADGHMYGLVYDAPRRHYFELDLSTFESVHKSFKWKTAGVSHVTKATE